MQDFCRAWFEKSKIEDIAKTAGIGKSTIYEYFDSKMMVYMKLFESVLDSYTSHLTAILKNDASLKEKLLKYMRLHCDSISEQYQMISMHLQETMYYNEIRDLAFDRYTFVHQLLIDCFEDSAKKNEIRPDIDLNCACNLIYGAIQRISFDTIFGRKQAMSNQSLYTLVDSILNVLSR